MPLSFDTVLLDGTLCDGRGEAEADIGIRKGKIAAVGNLARAKAAQRLSLRGLHIVPGVIDSQVHFREPGAGDAETLESGSRGALMGGVTGVFEMPNTMPPTTTRVRFREKMSRAKGRMFCNYGFYLGGVAQNALKIPQLEKEKGCCGIKVFMGSSTGNLLTDDDETIARILEAAQKPVAFHAEDESRLRARRDFARKGRVETHAQWRDVQTALLATRRLLHLARKKKKRVHILHVSTAQEIELLAKHSSLASVEVTPQHLTLSAPECYERLGTYAQMNPPLRGRAHRLQLMRALQKGVVDVIGSDHAPHSRSAKRRLYPNSPSGMTGTQTLVPIMLHHLHAKKFNLPRFVELTSQRVAEIFHIPHKGRLAQGYDADLTILDLKATRQIQNRWIESLCRWTPYDGMKIVGWPVGALMGGRLALWEEALYDPLPQGKPILFNRP